MHIEFSKHALDQLKARKRITKSMVLDAIENPNKVIESFRGRKLYQKLYGTEILEIVTIQEDNKLTVITQYFLESI